MTTAEIAHIFENVSTLLELKGENPFRIKTYVNASRTLRGLEISLEEFLLQLQNKQVKGFGPQLTEHLLTICQTGELPYLTELRKEFPQGLLELLNIPGLGVKKVKLLYQSLEITSIKELEDACLNNKLSTVKGFGSKTQDNILAALIRYKSYNQLISCDGALEAAQALSQYLEQCPHVLQIEIAGDVRRGSEVVNQIIAVASSNEPEKLADFFAAYPEINSILSSESQHTTAQLNNNIPATLCIVSEEEFSTALLYYTGNEEHVSKLIELAQNRQLELGPCGIHSSKQHLAVRSEAEIYDTLGLSFIPPELREDHGEIELAGADSADSDEFFPLLQESDIKGVLHVHTTYSDGIHSLRELANKVKELGYQYLGISDHSQSAFYAQGLLPDDIKRQHEEIDQLNEELAPLKIFKGIESDILDDGSLDYPDKILESFDFIIASVHSRLKMNKKEMTKRILAAVANPYTMILGHPTGRLLLQREAYEVNLPLVLETAAKHRVAVELNANPKRLDLDWRYHQMARDLGVIVPICPDAHSIQGIRSIAFGVSIARKGRLRVSDVLSCWDTSAVENFFKNKRSG